MSAAVEHHLAVALQDPDVVARYHARVRQHYEQTACWWWVGAVAGHGHGRFYLGATQAASLFGPVRETHVVIAHRFGYALAHGLEALLRAEVLAHVCDNPLCQRPDHLRESTPGANRREYYSRRGVVLAPLADVRGARRRARELRDAVRAGGDLHAAIGRGARSGHRDQLPLFELEHERGV